MSILVNTPTGHIGSHLTRKLVEAGHPVTVIARNPEKLGDLANRVKVIRGTIDDTAVLDQALQGAEALFWLSPPPNNPDLKGTNHRRAQMAVAAAKKHGVKRAVVLSSISAQVPAGTGPIASLHLVEKEFRGAFADVVILRPGFFMENHFASVGTIAAMGTIFAPAPGNAPFPQVATRDIADRAAHLLADDAWSGQRVLGLHGPADLGFDEVAEIIGGALGRPVNFVTITPEQAREGMLQAGLPDFLADSYLEMYASMGNGVFQQAEPSTLETTTPTTFAQFAADTLKPAIEAAAKAGASA